jgi:hypothetical protein
MRYFLIFDLVFLTEVEKAYLRGTPQFTRDQGYYIKSRMLKKLRVFAGTELPLLAEKGYLAVNSKNNLAASCKKLLRIMMI